MKRLRPAHATRDGMVGAWLRNGVGALEESVGGGVLERRIDWGPGYRVYFGRDGDRLIVLLGGGTKQRQQQDIVAAQGRWADYKLRNRS